MTYVKTWDGWAYMATMIDLHSRTLVGWAIADHMRTELVTAALDMAIANRRPPAGVIFHSDRGCQYTSQAFADYCKKHGIRRSLGRTGICFDNAVSESFFATYKKELIHTRPWPTIADLIRETRDWVRDRDRYPDHRRGLPNSCGGVSPQGTPPYASGCGMHDGVSRMMVYPGGGSLHG